MSDYTAQSMERFMEFPEGAKQGGADKQSQKKPGLPRPPLYTDDYITMAEALEFMMEQFGKLILALMYYTANGTMPDDLSPDLKVMFSIYQKKIDFAREKYEKKCATNAENGAKGGKAKAENAQKKSSGAKFRPPTLKQFQAAVKHFVDEGEISGGMTDYDVDSFFDELNDAGWTIGGAPIQSRTDWEMAIKAKFYHHDCALPDHYYYMIFSAVFADFRACEDADSATYDFMETYDEDSRCWIVQDKRFPAVKWKDALAQFMERYSDFSDT